jgi:hypothetical protein
MLRETLPEDLQPFEVPLGTMIRDALHRYVQEFGHVRATTSTIRGERNNIHDCMTAVSKTRFPYVVEGNLFLILLGRYRIRPKKFSVKLETSNYPTQSSFNFDNQITYPLFPELEPINLNVGYVPDPIDPRQSTIWLTQPGPDGWEYQLRPEVAIGSNPLPPLPATDPNQKPVTSRVTAKRRKKTQDSENEG